MLRSGQQKLRGGPEISWECFCVWCNFVDSTKKGICKIALHDKPSSTPSCSQLKLSKPCEWTQDLCFNPLVASVDPPSSVPQEEASSLSSCAEMVECCPGTWPSAQPQHWPSSSDLFWELTSGLWESLQPQSPAAAEIQQTRSQLKSSNKFHFTNYKTWWRGYEPIAEPIKIFQQRKNWSNTNIHHNCSYQLYLGASQKWAVSAVTEEHLVSQAQTYRRLDFSWSPWWMSGHCRVLHNMGSTCKINVELSTSRLTFVANPSKQHTVLSLEVWTPVRI